MLHSGQGHEENHPWPADLADCCALSCHSGGPRHLGGDLLGLRHKKGLVVGDLPRRLPPERLPQFGLLPWLPPRRGRSPVRRLLVPRQRQD